MGCPLWSSKSFCALGGRTRGPVSDISLTVDFLDSDCQELSGPESQPACAPQMWSMVALTKQGQQAKVFITLHLLCVL